MGVSVGPQQNRNSHKKRELYTPFKKPLKKITIATINEVIKVGKKLLERSLLRPLIIKAIISLFFL